ncbi:MAG: hypothetical protein IKM06_05170 [Clostridia bacterium]|nr:hypothetical protein [Clostridia bacterium]
MRTSIEKVNGVSYVAVDGKITDTLALKSFRPTKNNVSDFYKAGVRIFHAYISGLQAALKIPYSLFGEVWMGDKTYDFTNLDRQMDFFIENAPDGYIFVNIQLDTRAWWLEENQGRPNSFTHLSQIAADEKWKKDTADYLKALIEHVEEKYDDHVLGYFLLGGFTTEWFSQFDEEASHPIKLDAFRKYMGDASALIPEKCELERPENEIFLDPVRDKNVIEYRKFHNSLICELVLYYAEQAQEMLKHKKILGVFFGYIMELLDERLWNAGHLDIDKLYRSEHIDLIATPSSYQFRSYDDAGAYMLLCDTLDLNGKMYFASFDHKTFLLPTLDKNERRLCGDNRVIKAMSEPVVADQAILSTRQQTIDGMRREMMLRLSRRTGMWWFDMLEGWFYDDGLMAEIKSLVDSSKNLMEKPRYSVSEIAVFVSCESLYYVNKCSGINTEIICTQRDALARIGAPYDLFSFNDIDRIDKDKYKLYIFIDAFYMNDTQREYIQNEIKKNDRTLLFIGACDYVSENGFNKDNMEKMTGFKLDMLEKDEKNINSCNSTYGYKKIKTPTFCVEDASAEILGRYTVSRRCGLAKKKFNGYTTYFSGLGNISAEVLREIAKDANVFIYAENNVPTFINSGCIDVYNTRSEYTAINLKRNGTYRELFSGRVYSVKDNTVILPTGVSPAQMLIAEE